MATLDPKEVQGTPVPAEKTMKIVKLRDRNGAQVSPMTHVQSVMDKNKKSLDKYLSEFDTAIQKNKTDIEALSGGEGTSLSTLKQAIADETKARQNADKAIVGGNGEIVEGETNKALKTALGTAGDGASADGSAFARIAKNKADIGTNATGISTINTALGTGFSGENTVKASIEAVSGEVASEATARQADYFKITGVAHDTYAGRNLKAVDEAVKANATAIATKAGKEAFEAVQTEVTGAHRPEVVGDTLAKRFTAVETTAKKGVDDAKTAQDKADANETAITTIKGEGEGSFKKADADLEKKLRGDGAVGETLTNLRTDLGTTGDKSSVASAFGKIKNNEEAITTEKSAREASEKAIWGDGEKSAPTTLKALKAKDEAQDAIIKQKLDSTTASTTYETIAKCNTIRDDITNLKNDKADKTQVTADIKAVRGETTQTVASVDAKAVANAGNIEKHGTRLTTAETKLGKFADAGTKGALLVGNGGIYAELTKGDEGQILIAGAEGGTIAWGADKGIKSLGIDTTDAGAVITATLNDNTAPTVKVPVADGAQAGLVSGTAQTFNGNKTFAGNVIVSGGLTVTGEVVSVETKNLEVTDKLITVAKGATIGSLGTPAGIEITKGGAQSLTFADNTGWVLTDKLDVKGEVKATAFKGTADKALNSAKLNNKDESELDVNSATTATTCTGNAATATQVNELLKVGTKNFDGSAEVTLVAEDLDAYTKGQTDGAITTHYNITGEGHKGHVQLAEVGDKGLALASEASAGSSIKAARADHVHALPNVQDCKMHEGSEGVIEYDETDGMMCEGFI